MIAGSPTNEEAGELLANCVALYNRGVRTRDFDALLDLLTDDAVLEFEGTSERGPLTGKGAIAQHFDDDPPDDPIKIKRWKVRENTIVAEFAWTDIPEGGGCLILEPRDGLLARITMVFGGPDRRYR